MEAPIPNPSASSNMIKGIIALVVLAALAGVYFLATGNKGYGVGDKVFGEWATKTWYAGTIDKTCETGFSVKFNDGAEKCLTEAQLIKDKAPRASSLDVGSKIIAKWTGAAFYDGEITAKTEDKIKVKYYDGVEYEVLPTDLRLDPRVAK